MAEARRQRGTVSTFECRPRVQDVRIAQELNITDLEDHVQRKFGTRFL
jgi:hypothetical protein